MHIDAYAPMRIKSSQLVGTSKWSWCHGARRRNPRMSDGTSDDGLRARQDIRFLYRLLLESRPPANLPRALEAARPRLHPGPRGRAIAQAQQPDLYADSRGPNSAAALGRAAEHTALDQGRPAGAAARARQHRHRAHAHRSDG